jgi:hypothetical protein
MKKFKLIVAVGFISILGSSCDSHTYDEIGGYVENPSFEKNIKPLFDSQCTNCHYQGNTSEGNYNEYYDYTTIRESVEFGNTIRDIDTTKTMPKGGAPLSKAKIKLILQWKNTGFQP